LRLVPRQASLQHAYRDLDAVTAIAQHCGLDTLFVDFTTEPEAAAFIVKCPFSHFDFEKLARVFGEEAAQPGLFTLHLQDTALEDFEEPWLTASGSRDRRSPRRAAS